MEKHECQCEHASHSSYDKPGIVRGHPYGAIRPRVEHLRTTYGSFELCQRCRTNGHMQSTRHLTPQAELGVGTGW